MFTGIVRSAGRTVARRPAGDGVRIAVATGGDGLAGARVGDSIAVNGCCLTVVAAAPGVLEFEASAETLACTTGFPQNGAVNLEPAMSLSDRLDGHLVSGHVDATGTVTALEPVADTGTRASAGASASTRASAAARASAGASASAGADEGSFALTIEVPSRLARYIAPKGSIAVDGVSLTTNAVIDLPGGAARFTVNLIPHTLAVTTLGSLRPGAAVNLEVDLIARYLDRLRGADRRDHEPGG